MCDVCVVICMWLVYVAGVCVCVLCVFLLLITIMHVMLSLHRHTDGEETLGSCGLPAASVESVAPTS